MKEFARAQPELFSFVVFVISSVACIVTGWILAVFIASRDCEPRSPSDPCDGPAMAAGAIFMLSILVSFVAGIILGISSYIKYRHQERQKLP
jgi:uncharacterized protein YneF (UPF0154 family)